VRRVRRTTTVIATNPEEVLCRSPEYRGSDITGDQPVDERLSVGTPPTKCASFYAGLQMTGTGTVGISLSPGFGVARSPGSVGPTSISTSGR
jgi:hypothetical protein